MTSLAQNCFLAKRRAVWAIRGRGRRGIPNRTGNPKTQAPKPSLGTLRVSLLPRRMLKCDPLGHPYVDRILFSKSEPPAFGSDEAEGFELRGCEKQIGA